jgi:hypothetical protein
MERGIYSSKLCLVVNRLQNSLEELKSILEQYPEKDGEEYLRFCDNQILRINPEIKIRWARIYGSRWAHLLGNFDDIALKPLRIKLNNNYGILIDNSNSLPPADLQQLIAILKECFEDGPLSGTRDS